MWLGPLYYGEVRNFCGKYPQWLPRPPEELFEGHKLLHFLNELGVQLAVVALQKAGHFQDALPKTAPVSLCGYLLVQRFADRGRIGRGGRGRRRALPVQVMNGQLQDVSLLHSGHGFRVLKVKQKKIKP